jgi:hypothetical protein
MSNQKTQEMSQLDREKAAFLYSSALERGDFETVALMLEEAQRDATLERMIIEINEEFGRECDESLVTEAVLAEDAARVEQILRECVPSGSPGAAEDDAELPPLTVHTVLAQMQEDSSLKASVRQEAASLRGTLRQADVPLPGDLSQRGVRHFFSELGVTAGELLQKMFRQAAIFLAMGREQDMAQLAATRRQRRPRAAGRKPRGESEE